jgi:disulfide bond formation protein DsbB
MNSTVSLVLNSYATLTVIGQILVVLLVLLLIVSRFSKNKSIKSLSKIISGNSIVFVLIVVALATLGSLFFSEIAGFTPCKLCWFQRICMYPLTVISLVAVLTNDTKVKKYILPLAIIGLGVAIYHILLQIYPNTLQCGDELVSCAKTGTRYYGYITIPVMSATAFLLSIITLLIGDRS